MCLLLLLLQVDDPLQVDDQHRIIQAVEALEVEDDICLIESIL